MKLRVSLVIAVLTVLLSAVVAVATPTSQAKTGGSLVIPAGGTTTTGQSVTGTFNITSFKLVNGAIRAVGTFTGPIGGAASVTTPAYARVTSINGTQLTGSSAAAAAQQAAGSCQILDLTLGPLHLDLLGLVVDLNQVHLTITAEQGPGNLLGNLLCAVAHLLDNTGTGGLQGLLQSIVNLLNQILAQL
jgi:hypothetical protein